MAYCITCGNKLNEGEAFCGSCGTKVSESTGGNGEATYVSEVAATAVLPPISDTVVEHAENAEAAALASSPKKKNTARNIIIGIAALVVIAGGIGGGLVYKNYLDEQAAYELAHQAHPVEFTVIAPEYNAEQDSPIPLQVTGTDLDGNAVEEIYYVGSEGEGVDLLQGEYQLCPLASPLLSSGDLYRVPAEPVSFTLLEDGSIETNLQITFEVMPADEITDEEIASAGECALDSGMPQEEVDVLKQAVIENRQRAIEEKEAALAAAAEEEARRAALSNVYNLADYLYALPETIPPFLNNNGFYEGGGGGFANANVPQTGREIITLQNSSGSALYQDTLLAGTQPTQAKIYWMIDRYGNGVSADTYPVAFMKDEEVISLCGFSGQSSLYHHQDGGRGEADFLGAGRYYAACGILEANGTSYAWAYLNVGVTSTGEISAIIMPLDVFESYFGIAAANPASAEVVYKSDLL